MRLSCGVRPSVEPSRPGTGGRSCALLLVTFLALPAATARAAIPESERNVLLALYASTNGDGWTHRDGWQGKAGTECSWYGVTCNDEAYVSGLRLGSNNLTGALPPNLDSLTHLTSFAAADNRLSGSIPPLDGLTALAVFEVYGNLLTGSLPSLGDLASLWYFRADSNQLTGSIPPLTALTNLQLFNVQANLLTGSIPPLTGLTNLTAFVASDNRLTGILPSVPSPNHLRVGASFLCPNYLNHTTDPAWDAATGVTPWYASCPGAPTASFGWRPARPVQGQTVAFTDTSAPAPTSWQWAFGDGASSSAQFPTHAYSSCGNFSVTLTASNPVGTSSAGQQVTVEGCTGTPAVSSFSASPSNATVGQVVSFACSATGSPSPVYVIAFGDGASTPSSTATHAYGSPGSYSATCTAANSAGAASSGATVSVWPSSGGCSPTATELCLLGDRFRVTASYVDYGQNGGVGQAVALTPDTGTFWFFNAANVEAVVKMVSFCGGGSNNVAVYANGLTDLEVTLHVVDTRTGTAKDYRNPLGRPFALIRDGPFTCPAAVAGFGGGPTALAEGEKAQTGPAGMPSRAGPPAFDSTCSSDATTLCLFGGRFQVQTIYQDYAGKLGIGQAVPLTSDTGYFWFFNRSSLEVIAKMVSFCTGGAKNVGVYASGLTDVGVTLVVTDTLTGLVKTYSNALGNPFDLVRDGPFVCQ